MTTDFSSAPTSPRRPVGHGFTAILLATAPALGDGPAAALAWDGTTLGARLRDQLGELGAEEVHLITRPAWSDAAAAAPGGDELRVHASAGLAEDMRVIAAIAEAGDGPVVVANADIVTQGEALAGLLADPGIQTGVLVSSWRASRLEAFGVQARVGHVVTVGTPYHHIAGASQRFLGVIKIGAADRLTLAKVAGDFAQTLERPMSAWWQRNAALKERQWRLALHRRALRRSAGDGSADDADDEDGDAEQDDRDDEPPLSPADEAELAGRLAAAREDATALLVRGLVNAHVAVALGRLRGLFWARPLSDEDVADAASRIAGHDEEEALLRSAVKPSDGFFTTFFVSPYSKYIARWAARRGWTPNLVTSLSMAVGMLAAAAFATGERAGMIAGALLLQAAFTLDCVDGQLARYTRTFSRLGAWLDSIFDRGKEYVVYAGLAIGASAAGDDVWLLAGAALALQTARHMSYLAFNSARDEALQAQLAVPQYKRAKDDAVVVPAAEEAGAGEWARKIVAFPIGERFAALSVTAALFDARTTFVVLLAWGGVAAAYTTAGRLARSLGRRRETAVTAAVDPGVGPLPAYRDDGVLARAVARLSGRARPVPPLALVLAGIAPGLVAIAATRADASWALVAAVVAWAVVWLGASGARIARDRLRWTIPPLLRASEYGGVLWIAAVAGDAAHPAAVALLGAVAIRHYDVAYRYAQRSAVPPRALGLLLGGWDGRIVVATALAAAGAARTGIFAMAVAVGLLAAGEAVGFWLRGDAGEGPVPADGGD